jgi:hypothetical protein
VRGVARKLGADSAYMLQSFPIFVSRNVSLIYVFFPTEYNIDCGGRKEELSGIFSWWTYQIKKYTQY